MKKSLLLLAVLLVCGLSPVLAQFEGTWGMGVHTGYGMNAKSLAVGGHLHYYLNNNLRVAPSFTYYLPRENKHTWDASLDAHWVIPVSVSASLYPLIGVGYSQWRYAPEEEVAIEPTDYTHHRPMANVGLGVQHDIAYRIRATFEMKYQFMKDYEQMVFMAGFGFWF